MTTSGIANDNERQRMTSSGKTNDNEWYNEWQRVVQQVTTNDSKRQQVTKNGNVWQWITASDKTNEYEWE